MITLLRRRRAMPCQELVELITAYLEDGLPRRDRARFEAHLAVCEHCSEYVEQFRTTIELTGRAPAHEDLAPSERYALLAAFHDWSPT